MSATFACGVLPILSHAVADGRIDLFDKFIVQRRHVLDIKHFTIIWVQIISVLYGCHFCRLHVSQNYRGHFGDSLIICKFFQQIIHYDWVRAKQLHPHCRFDNVGRCNFCRNVRCSWYSTVFGWCESVLNEKGEEPHCRFFPYTVSVANHIKNSEEAMNEIVPLELKKCASIWGFTFFTPFQMQLDTVSS